MEGYTPRPRPAYPGDMTDENIRAIFDGAGDFFARRLQCGDLVLGQRHDEADGGLCGIVAELRCCVIMRVRLPRMTHASSEPTSALPMPIHAEARPYFQPNCPA